MIDTQITQKQFRDAIMLSKRIFKGKPLITTDHLAAYTPPSTNAQYLNAVNDQLTPITSESALILFSSPADVAKIMPLVLALDPNTRAFDGSGVVCPVIQYGSDGRKVNCVEGIVTIAGASYAYEAAIGIIIAASYWGPGWNGGNQPPYTVLTAGVVDPQDAQINWTH
jgi:hypothetical protein